MATNPPDHSAIIAKVAVVEERTNTIIKRLDQQDVSIARLIEASNVEKGRRGMAKLILWTIPGAFGAGIFKLADWLGQGQPPNFPPHLPGAH